MLLELQVPFVAGHATTAAVADMEQAIRLNSTSSRANKIQEAQEKAAVFHCEDASDAHQCGVGPRARLEQGFAGRPSTSCRQNKEDRPHDCS